VELFYGFGILNELAINIPHWDDFVALIKDENCRLAPQKRNVERKNCVEMEIN